MEFVLAVGLQARSFAVTCGAILLLCASHAYAARVTLAWDASTAPVLGGYSLSYGGASGAYTVHVDVGAARSHAVTGLLDGNTYYFAVRAYDKTGTIWSDYSNEVCKAVGTAPAGCQVGKGGGLVAAYDFEEGGGPRVVDASEHRNQGIVAGAVRTRRGRFGKALSFNGKGDWVTIKDTPSLNLEAGMTLEAWIYPSDFMSGRRTILFKEGPAEAASYHLDANSETDRPAAGFFSGSPRTLEGGSGLMPDNWAHLTATYDGSTMRLYLNGDQVAEAEQSGYIDDSGGALGIGGNSVWGDFFEGRIDEVRIYNRALSSREIRADMNVSIAASLKPRALLGYSKKGSVIVDLQAGQAQAYQTTAAETGWVTRLAVYAHQRSGTPKIVAGLYSNTNGHPGALLAHGRSSKTSLKGWMHIPIHPLSVKAGRKYWIAVLGQGGILKLRKRALATGPPAKTSAQLSLATLPRRWKSGSASLDGRLSAYGAGYR